MARASDPNSADSQFFICFDDAPLPRQAIHGVGHVSVDGMENVDTINTGEPPAKPDTIVTMQVAADAG